jgi:hypothetical protein
VGLALLVTRYTSVWVLLGELRHMLGLTDCTFRSHLLLTPTTSLFNQLFQRLPWVTAADVVETSGT